MSVEYWLIDAENGNAQGCYLSLDDALRAAEIEVEAQGAPIQSLKLLGMRSHRREPQGHRSPEPAQRVSVRFDLGINAKVAG